MNPEDRPKRILLEHTVSYAVMQVMLWVALAYAIRTKDSRAWLLFCANIALPPIYIWATYLTLRTAWRGKPRDEVNDVSVPTMVVVIVCAAIYLLFRY